MNKDDGDFDIRHEEHMDIGFGASDKLDLNVEQDVRSTGVAQGGATHYGLPPKDEINTDEVLKIGTEFESDEHAYRFYNQYARLLGFNVRKDWVNRSKIHGQVVSRKFTCSREGYRRKDKRDVSVKKHRKETRTGCLAHMIITRQHDGKYHVTHFEAKHNHDNINPNNTRILPLQNELHVPAAETDLPNNVGTQSNEASELVNRRYKVWDPPDCLSVCSVNYLKSERVRSMKEGEAAHLLHYFQWQHFGNPSFFYSVMLDIDDKISNIFWSDDNMVVDYNHFGDVVFLDSTFRTKKDFQPFVQFIGVNHHNQALIFAAALLFDDTVESLKWLFRTFMEAMSGKKPKVFLTDQDASIIEAINSVFPDTDHHICVWQMYQNALQHLSNVVKDTESFANDLRSCIYDHKDEECFIHAWEIMLEKYALQQNEWLRWMFRERERWATVYGRNTFLVDMQGSHLGETLSNKMRSHLNSDHHLLPFFKHFEQVLNEQQYDEIKANIEMSRCLPKLMGNVVLLKHASEFYTPRAFEVFQREYEKCLNIVVNQCRANESLLEYKVNTFGQSREYTVTFDSSDDTVTCSCMKFECVGFLCSHALKVLDHRNIKVVPSRYILKRWTKDARIGSLRESCDLGAQDSLNLAAAGRYKNLCHSTLNIAARAAESEEAFHFASRQLHEVIEGIEKILSVKPDDARGNTSSSMDANGSEGESAEIFLDVNVTEEEDENYRTKEMKNANVKSSETVQKHPLINTVTCISSLPPGYISPQAPAPNPVLQGLYNFEGNQVADCVLEQSNPVMEQQTAPNLYQQPNFYTNQHDSSNQTHILQEPLMSSTYHEPISNANKLRQTMDLGNQHPHSSSFLLYHHRYRDANNPYLGPK